VPAGAVGGGRVDQAPSVLKAGDQVTHQARAVLQAGLSAMEARGDFDAADFGNARYVRTLVEKAAQARDLRLFGDPSRPPGHQAPSSVVRSRGNDGAKAAY
jgi:hypothetical protein